MINLKDEEFIKALISENEVNVYFVGGCVRDHLLKLPSKDIDLVVTGINMPALVSKLEKYGKADLVGESFGVIKFKPFNYVNKTLADLGVIDIAIPRVEVKTGDGHKDFEVVASSTITLEEDLFRRDFTINSMAMTLDYDLIDPYNGKKDLEDKILECTSFNTFADDALRILRALRFVTRFNFELSSELHYTIANHIKYITHISPERILEEFKKTYESSTDYQRSRYIKLISHFRIPLKDYIIPSHSRVFENIQFNTFTDFMFVLLGTVKNSDVVYKHSLNGDYSIMTDLKALEMLRECNDWDKYSRLIKLIEIYKISLIGDESDLYKTPELLLFRNGTLPRKISDLSIKGGQVAQLIKDLGYKPEDIGIAQQRIHQAVVLGSIKNTIDDALWFIKQNYPKKEIKFQGISEYTGWRKPTLAEALSKVIG